MESKEDDNARETRSSSNSCSDERRVGVISTIFIAKKSAAPMESITSAKLMAGVGIQGDRYSTRKGTYSGRFLSEPGRNLTMVSLDAIQDKLQRLVPEKHSFTIDKLRRNIIVKGLSASDLNDMVGREIQMGACRLFVHRRNVPCKYREAETRCPNFMNTFWEDCGVCCEILDGGIIQLGDAVSIIPHVPYQPKRCNVGLKPPGFFIKPSERSLEVVKGQIIPVHIALALCLYDPEGFEQVEAGYQAVGQHFWSPQAYRAGMFFKTHVRTPLIITLGVGAVSIVVAVIMGSKVW